jgi:hypothetical protein
MTGNVSIMLYDYTPATATYVTLASNVGIGAGTWNWTVPAGQTLGGMYRIRVLQSTPVVMSDLSDAYFAVGVGAPSVRVTSPNGGETITRGAPCTIAWNTNGIAGPVAVYLYNCTTSTSENIASSVKPSPTGVNTISWTVPAGHAVGTQFKIRVISSGTTVYSDYSDSEFTIN